MKVKKPVMIILMIFICYNSVAWLISKYSSEDDRILTDGVDVTLKILSVNQSDLFINNNPVLIIDVIVLPQTNKKIHTVQSAVKLINFGKFVESECYKGKYDAKGDKAIFLKSADGAPEEVSCDNLK